MKNSFVVYPGTFDPVTRGHLDIVARASRIFGRVEVAVVRTSRKELTFDAGLRLRLVEESLREAGIEGTEARVFDGLLVDYMRSRGFSVFLRGLRAISDFEYELQMQLMNRKLDPGITGVYLMPSEEYIYLSSTLVKEIATEGGDVSTFVYPCVGAALLEWASGQVEPRGSSPGSGSDRHN